MSSPPALGSRYLLGAELDLRPVGSSWQARDRLQDRDVVIRILPEGPWPVALAALRGGAHPSLAALGEAGSLPDGGLFVVYDLPGPLAFGTPGAPVEQERWIGLVAQFLEALEYIHGLGWAHGDLSVGSVHWREADDHLVVSDPGAMLCDPAALALARLAAPELAAGGQPTVSSDLFSAGVLAATALSGEVLFDSPDGGLSAHGLVAAPASEAVVRWLSGLLRADPALRPASATEALRGLEEASGQVLARPEVALSKLRSVGAVGRHELVGRLAVACASGGVGIVLGDQASGRTTVLRAIQHRLRMAGRAAELIEMGSDPVTSHRALRFVLADHCAFNDEPPRRDLPPAELAAGLRSYEASLQAATVELLHGAAGPFLFDDVDTGTLAGRVLAAAMERCPNAGAALATDGASQRMMEGLVAGRADARDVPAVLSPLHGEQIAKWLHQALGPVAKPFALAELLADETDGLPGLVLSQVGLLLDRGALHPGEQDWRWSPDQVLPLLGGVTQPMRHAGLSRGTPQEQVDVALEAAERAAAAADPRAALALLKSEIERRGLHDALPTLLAPLWERMAHLALVIEDPAEAAHWLARLREEAPAPQPGRRADLLVQECRALRASARWRKALNLLEAGWEEVLGAEDTETRLYGWATLASCHLKAGSTSAAEAAISTLEAQTEEADAAWLTRSAALRADLELRLGRPQAAADACIRVLSRLGDDDRFFRATLSTLLATAMRALGRTDEAITGFQGARDLLLADGRLLEAARVVNKLGLTRFLVCDWTRAMQDWQAYLAVARSAGDPWEQCCALANLGGLHRDLGQFDHSAESLEEALQIARRHRLGRLEPLAMSGLAETWARMGDTALAADALQEAIDLAERTGHWREAAEATQQLAILRLDQGDRAAAGRLLSQARRTAEHLDDADRAHQLDALTSLLGILGEGTKEGDETRALEAIRALADRGATVAAARLRLRLAEALVGTTRYGPAETLLDDAEQVLRPLEARPDLARIEEARRHLVRATRSSLQTLTRHHDWLQELTLALARERDLDPLVELVLDRALELVGEERGLVQLFDEVGVPSLQVSRRIDATDTGRHRVVSEEQASADPRRSALASVVIARVVASRRPVVIPDANEDVELADLVPGLTPALRGIVCVPILRAKDLLGVIYVDGSTVMGSGSEVRAELLMACAEAASVAIENARLIEALKRKQDALAIMAHELRTPITSIIGFASLLLSPDEDRTPQEDTEMLALIKSEAERVRGMVGRVLELAQMQAADAEWRRAPVDVLALVVTGVDSLRALARQSDVKLQAFVAEDLPDAWGDEERLVQVMVNLIGNALKFVPFGGQVEVRARASAGGVLITVEDDGPGIAKERLSRIFEPWQQAGSARMRRKGVGLGLAISHAIVVRHGGWIRAENRTGRGARFSLWLPTAP